MKAYENPRMTDWAIKQVGDKMLVNQARTGPFHASEIYSCFRKIYRNRTEPKTFDAETILKFALGFAMQEWFFGVEEEGKVLNGVIYSPDHVFDPNNLGEFKTTRRGYEKYAKTADGKMDKTVPKVRFDVTENESWIDRTGAYCAEFNINKAHILVFFLFSNELHAWTLEFTDAELEFIREENARRRDELTAVFKKASRKNAKLPPVTSRTGDWECKFCPYLSDCLPELKKDNYQEED